ncbi:aspartate dehydrogenase [Ruegeria sp. HKCCD8929]|uniref:aspartate dehydrogenase n=1 Tax=Ruegeria sp. HKCCD8929 TaxID=2683006 RepID=UPI00353006C0
MMLIAFIGHGAIASHAARRCPDGAEIIAVICRPGREAAARQVMGAPAITEIADLPKRPDLLIDCAGHAGLRAHGLAALRAGIDVLTVSVGALADAELHSDLVEAAEAGQAQLSVASGAIGSLDALSAAAEGGALSVTYTGRKPPLGWRGSWAEEVLDLGALTAAATHFEGSAREAARLYPRNANVAAAVALAGAGLDNTRAVLIADPDATRNIHEVQAEGAFGRFRFEIQGNALPDNPSSSALTAMSVVREIRRRISPIQI